MRIKKTYEQWSKEVDQEIQRQVGLSADDLPDWPQRDWYEDGKSPKQAAKSAIARAKREYGL